VLERKNWCIGYRGIPCLKMYGLFLKLDLGDELLNFALFSMNFDAIENILNALDKEIPCAYF